MKFKQFMYKLFPCMNKEESHNNEQSQQDIQRQKDFLEEHLAKERQKKLEELRNSDLEQQRLENERMAREEFENILKEAEQRAAEEELKRAAEEELKRAAEEELKRVEKEAEERAAEEELKRHEELRKLEEAQIAEEQNLLEQEKLKENNIKNITHVVFETYKEKYHEFYSTRQQPIHSNFNEKMFKDLCNKFTFSTEEELLTCLNDYNNMRKNNKNSYNELSTKRKLKCDVFKFYLFI
jgi:hypothetical protein